MLCFVLYFDNISKCQKIYIYKSDNALTDDFKRECDERQKKNPRDVTGVRGAYVIVTVDIITREKN